MQRFGFCEPNLHEPDSDKHLLSYSGMNALPTFGATHSIPVCRTSSQQHPFQPFRQARSHRKKCQKPFCALVAQQAQTTQSLEQWCRRNKVDPQHCKLDTYQNQPVLSASLEAQPGQTLLSVPQSQWLTVEIVAKSDIAAAVSHLDGWLQLALYLLHSRQLADSPALDYISSLPDSLDVPLLWTDAQLRLLEGTQVLSTVEGYRYNTPYKV